MMFTTAFGILSVLSGLFTAASAGPPKMPKKVHGLPQEIWCPRWGNQRKQGAFRMILYYLEHAT